MIRKKDIEEYFHEVDSTYIDGVMTYILYGIENGCTYGTYNTRIYVGHVCKWKNGYFQVPGYEPTNKIDVLLNQIDERKRSFKYLSEFYNPMLRKGYFEEAVIHHFMSEQGFDNNKSWGAIHYSKKQSNVYGARGIISISITGLDSFEKIEDEVEITMMTDDWSWVNFGTIKRDADTIIEKLNGILKILYISNASQDLNLSKKLLSENFDIIKKTVSGLTIAEENIKQDVIKELEEVLHELKK
jgi:hypothetical protein